MLFVTLGLISSCTDDFDELNTPSDEIVASNVDASLLGQAFAQSQYRGMKGLDWQFQITEALFADLYAQYFATTAANFDSDQYIEVGRWSDLAWSTFYGDAAPQLDFVLDFTEREGLTLQNAIAEVWKVQLYHRVTDYWGPIIYSEFGNGETSVPYDSQESVYKDFFTTLDEAVEVLKNNAGGNAFGSNDIVFGGSVDKWLRFANSLRLRLAMRIRYVESDLAKSEAEKAFNDGVMMSNADNAYVLTTPNSRNPYTVITDWGEFRMSSAMESLLDGYEDPRIDKYFSPAVDGDDDGDGRSWEGMRNGIPRTEKPGNLNSRYSDMGVNWLNDNRGGTNPPMEVMEASEIYFLRAEGALIGWEMGGTAQELYEEGIRMSLQQNSGASTADINNYISSTNTPTAPGDQWNSPPLTDIPVAWEAGASLERNLEQIITQKWIALYPNSREAWAEYRRTRYPKLYPIIESLNPELAENDIFSRISFVDGEYSDNEAATIEARNLLNGSDNNATKLWWDAKPN
ncbi:SusD/RagB family nutrient-binding outer membrane lipoprotein [Aliifodinibius sp. S!AR15-10]|uniref:SusD/RagB family nutrient-binding outer membrane lipoprotein n=1 Tax=Aliifodinibius sp. S!AR15-10 TaxID=2950437 RepID=UPI00285ED885|nr:SusD/RagB family nutrient-binding outer membrane lipoprotein [Aliifodinibius sp. S!AR15-10]MDR8392135.1 SusD/RagB family nutrient-binding outer membrane lipoprotein [Aliifodinibius sp. S!AR15-10]